MKESCPGKQLQKWTNSTSEIPWTFPRFPSGRCSPPSPEPRQQPTSSRRAAPFEGAKPQEACPAASCAACWAAPYLSPQLPTQNSVTAPFLTLHKWGLCHLAWCNLPGQRWGLAVFHYKHRKFSLPAWKKLHLCILWLYHMRDSRHTVCGDTIYNRNSPIVLKID